VSAWGGGGLRLHVQPGKGLYAPAHGRKARKKHKNGHDGLWDIETTNLYNRVWLKGQPHEMNILYVPRWRF
jgi:hypothetical protein